MRTLVEVNATPNTVPPIKLKMPILSVNLIFFLTCPHERLLKI